MPSHTMSSPLANFTRVSRSLIERAMELRCQAYLSNAKHMLLLQTIMEIDSSKRDLAATNQQLRELDKIKTLFIAGLTHELNNPLSAIIGYTELIMKGMAGPLNEIQQQYMRNVATSAEHLKEIVADALDIAKIESNALEPNYSTFDLSAAVEEAVCQLEPVAREKGLMLVIQNRDANTLYSDKRRLVQCLINLISNAIKYSSSGSVDIATSRHGDSIDISIRDYGTGLSDEDLKNLFEIFHRGVSAKRSKEMGHGIGLFLTHKLVHNTLRGTIDVKSELHKGSTFTITLPISTAENS
ncbi:MAG: HAMP domain-containing histidine kinase [Chromatiales bacterium]|nr:HAMP domain-containing histidine kinase [Chromatiales bacterium]